MDAGDGFASQSLGESTTSQIFHKKRRAFLESWAQQVAARGVSVEVEKGPPSPENDMLMASEALERAGGYSSVVLHFIPE